MNQVAREWHRLLAVPKGELLNTIASDATSLGADLYQIGPESYCVVDDPDVDWNQLTVIGLLWACSANAARRAFYNEIEADDYAECSPPDHVFPGVYAGSTYSDIVRTLAELRVNGLIEHASYRVMTDGRFVHSCIEFDKATYYFRSPEPAVADPPYAILWKMR